MKHGECKITTITKKIPLLTRKMSRGQCKGECERLGSMYNCDYAGEVMQDGYREPLKFSFMPPVPPRLPPPIPPMPEKPQKPKKPPGFNWGQALLGAGKAFLGNVVNTASNGGFSKPVKVDYGAELKGMAMGLGGEFLNQEVII